MSTERTRSHYTILGVAPRATSKEIRVAYLNLARALHPDRVHSGSVAEQQLAERRMREVNAAYEVLGDAVRRRAYDRERGAASSTGASARPSTPAPGRGATAGSSAPRPPRGNPERFDADPSLRDDEGRIRNQVWLDEDVEVSPLVAFLIRRGPLLLVLLVAIVLFIGTAYATGPTDDPTPAPTTVVNPCNDAPINGVSGGSVVLDPC
jgi:hypothetical protein